MSEPSAPAPRPIRLFRNGRNQALRIPREFELAGQDATIRKEGNRLIIEPAARPSLLRVLDSLPTLDIGFESVDTGVAALDDIKS